MRLISILLATVFLAWFQRPSQIQAVPPQDPNAFTMQDGSKLFIPPGGVHEFEMWDSKQGVILTCKDSTYEKGSPWKLTAVKNCSLENGHTLDDVVWGMMQTHQYETDALQGEVNLCIDYLKKEDEFWKVLSRASNAQKKAAPKP